MKIKNKQIEFELFFDDLTSEAQKRFLKACNIKNASDCNEDFPIGCFIIEGLRE